MPAWTDMFPSMLQRSARTVAVLGGEYAPVKSRELFKRPYARVVLVLLKTGIDVVMHVRSHAKRRPDAAAASHAGTG